MVAEIADFDTKYYINPEKNSKMNENHEDFVFSYKLASEVWKQIIKKVW